MNKLKMYCLSIHDRLLDKIQKLNEICIDKEFMNNKEIYGHFYIFHDHKQEDLNNLLFVELTQ